MHIFVCLNYYILTNILRCSSSGGSLSFVGCFFGLLSSSPCFLCGALSFTCDVLKSIRILFHGPLLALETLFCILLFSLQGSSFTCLSWSCAALSASTAMVSFAPVVLAVFSELS